MKKTTRNTMTMIAGLVLALSLAWMVFLTVTASALGMTVIPAAVVCGAAAIVLAKLDQRRSEERPTHDASDANTTSRVA